LKSRYLVGEKSTHTILGDRNQQKMYSLHYKLDLYYGLRSYIAEVMGSTPTRSISYCKETTTLVETSISLVNQLLVLRSQLVILQ